MTTLKASISSITQHPGIYKMLDRDDHVIYVGKAKNLKKRVTSYFSKSHHDLKTDLLVSLICSVQTIVTNTENEALILERELVRTYKPRFNILLKDDKSYPYIKITTDIYPKLVITREKKKDNAAYFGPFPSIGSSKYLERTLLKLFPLRTCKQNISLDKKEKKCILLDIGKCIGPCINKSIKTDYDHLVEELELFLKGRNKELVKRLKKNMQHYSETLKYEQAAIIRDRLLKLEQLTEKQFVSLDEHHDYSIWAVEKSKGVLYVLVQEIIGGKLLYQHGYFTKRTQLNNDNEFIEQSILEWCSEKKHTKKQSILCTDAVEEILTPLLTQFNLPYTVLVPQKGDKKILLDGAMKNSRLALSRLTASFVTTKQVALEDAQEALELQHIPKRIFGFDISHLQGTNIVASCVCFVNGRPSKKDYRQFLIKTVTVKSNDPKSMKEVVYRRLKRVIKDKEEMPQLLLIDGGKAQLNFAMKALRECELDETLDCISIAKRYEDLYKDDWTRPRRLLKDNPVLQLLQAVRDESHRFAVSFQRKKRRNQYESCFTSIKGMGKQRLKLLYTEFKTMDAIRKASAEEIEKRVKVSLSMAKEIKELIA